MKTGNFVALIVDQSAMVNVIFLTMDRIDAHHLAHNSVKG
jgi:hypothetical protein